ncbi:MAG: peptidase domain-containing ABC transporter [Flavobacteriales bacterium]
MKKEKQKPLRALWLLMKAERQEIRSIYIYAIFQGLVGLSLPLGIQAIINFIQAGQLSTSWYVLAAFVLGGILLAGYLQMKQLTVSETIEQRIFANTTFELATRVPRFSAEAVSDRYPPELLNRFFDVVTIQKGFSKLLIDFSAAVIQVVFGLLILILYHQYFLGLSVILILVLYGIFRFTGPGGLKTSLEESQYKYETAHWLQELSRNLSTFKLAGSTPLPLQRTDELTSKYLSARKRHFRILMVQFRALVFFKFIVGAGLIVLGSLLVINKQLNIGQFVAAEIIILLVMASIEKLILNMSTVYDVLTSLDKLNGIADIQMDRGDGNELAATRLQVEMLHVSYQFPDSKKPVLTDVSLKVNTGDCICISGPNGSGKTTLLRLLSGVYENYEGNIVVNGLSLKSLKLESYHAMIGENFTEHDIFKGSVAENISCGIPQISKEMIQDYSVKAGLSEFIANAPQGLDTILEPEGRNLPGSIRRKIILARCFASRPAMYLIEDNLTGLNQKERMDFFHMIFVECTQSSLVIVSNDPEIAERCSINYYLNEGKLTRL